MKNTLLSAIGFEDHDLKTPEHDRIMLWVDLNADAVAAEAWKFFRINELSKTGKYGEHRAASEFVGVAKKTWEMPVLAGVGRVIGFIDMRLDCHGRFDQGGQDRIVPVEINIEVKSTIKSIGELIRQVRAYHCEYFVVVCPDDRFAEIIRSQGIGFVKCPPVAPGHSGDLF